MKHFRSYSSVNSLYHCCPTKFGIAITGSGQGCAGRGIITAFDKLEELGVYEKYKPDIVLYDVLGVFQPDLPVLLFPAYKIYPNQLR